MARARSGGGPGACAPGLAARPQRSSRRGRRLLRRAAGRGRPRLRHPARGRGRRGDRGARAGRVNTLTYEVGGRIARITLDRPERGNGITLEMPRELAECVERADLDPNVHVIALSGNGKGFCGGYDLVESAEGSFSEGTGPPGSPVDPARIAANHDP